MTARLALDLFAGSGGATAALRSRGWDVITIDMGRPGRPSIVADVRQLPLRLPPGRDLGFLWASPPCTEFSTANARVDHRRKQPSLELVVAALQAVAVLRPRFWCIENVRGAIPFLGIPVQKLGPFCLWGYFPPLAVSLEMHDHRKGWASTAATRAAVPLALSEAMADALDRYWDLPGLLDLRPFRRHRHRAAGPHPAASGLELPIPTGSPPPAAARAAARRRRSET